MPLSSSCYFSSFPEDIHVRIHFLHRLHIKSFAVGNGCVLLCGSLPTDWLFTHLFLLCERLLDLSISSNTSKPYHRYGRNFLRSPSPPIENILSPSSTVYISQTRTPHVVQNSCLYNCLSWKKNLSFNIFKFILSIKLPISAFCLLPM